MSDHPDVVIGRLVAEITVLENRLARVDQLRDDAAFHAAGRGRRLVEVVGLARGALRSLEDGDATAAVGMLRRALEVAD